MANAESALKMAVCLLVMAELLLAKKDYYDILGVPKDATERQIKKAFHGLAMRYHPDRNNSPDAEVRFREIAEAYEMLSDVTRRGEYDQFGGSASYFTAGMQQRRSTRQPFSFKLEDILEDFNMDNHNSRHARQRQHFDEHSQRESHGRHKRNFEGAGFLGDLFDDVEKIFAFHMHPTQTEGIFHTSSKQHCRTVTQRRENMVTTYTDCTAI